jgi:hypothetical protein
MRQQLLESGWLRTPLADDQPLADTSADMAKRLVAQTKIGPNTSPVKGQWYTGYPYNMTVDAGDFSVPRYTMPPGHPRRRCGWPAPAGGRCRRCSTRACPCPSRRRSRRHARTQGLRRLHRHRAGHPAVGLLAVPPPRRATPAGYDWQCSAAGYHPAAPGWTGWYPATAGTINPALGKADGYGWGTAACGVTAIGARLMAEDYARGTINHKLGVALMLTGPGKLNPATRFDANNTTMTTGPAADALRIPEGACFRLPAGFDTAAWAKAHHTQASETVVEMACRAIRDHGLVVMDTSGVIQFAAEGAKTFGTPYNPHPTPPPWGNFGHDLPWDLMQQIEPPTAVAV